MSSSQRVNSAAPYLKAVTDCKGQFALWPPAEDTAPEAAFKCTVAVEGLSTSVVETFRTLVYGFYAEQRRNLPWREGGDPYRVLVSEVMLQQTQVERVIPKFLNFIERFPSARILAEAPLPDLLSAWQGLGYNRRALNLQRAARMVVSEWGNVIPENPAHLQLLPGIGPYTAGAIAAFAFNRAEIFLETNIRAVLLYFFFHDQGGIADKQLLPIAEAVLDRGNPRNWYSALMDYGSDLKRRFPNPSRRSRHHGVQGRFEGSDRQVRGAIVRLLLDCSAITVSGMKQELEVDRDRLERILAGLVQEGFMKKQGKRFSIL